ncbi:carboxymuconolactone decarboxylase family protein [Streptomyces sp. R1]|uniref:carboxymuconolactone decarboxylase family protein n=1 Tax=unclassified Streptomyces TaxID=2593676 RepID=UPI00052AE8A6|nr:MULTISPECIES: carboxymuconolactone decarboxylase family protein [unclassified Streptomyces]AIV34608.1 alkylhydroperoxidase [Streptomyces sp. CCM_MD2014]MCC8335647.1 carboxymuconolactone decarboxylase family protein [Streptomyces sp. R1]MDA4889711.1 carboxymuconolactone decarboxylase family protein [Streptomyces sp. MS2A]
MTARTTRLDDRVRSALRTVGAAAKRGLGDADLAELVQIRASQLNHCAFCLDMHLGLAREQGVGMGVPPAERSRDWGRRLDLLAAWEEAGEVFDARERAALALTEAVTVLTEGFVPDEVYEQAAAHFEEAELAHLLALIATINAWNRLMVARRIPAGSTQW